MDFMRAILALPAGASTVADRIDGLHFFVITVTMIMSTFVFIAAAWFTIHYHRKRDDQLTKRLTATAFREGGIIAAILVLFVTWWLIGYRQYIDIMEPPEDAEVVYVEAKQWMWKFAYPDGRSSNDTLTVPVGRPVKLVMTSRDVIHSFFVPEFRVKHDVIPGRYVTMWFQATKPGIYPIWCTEFCGVGHSLMRGQVRVLATDEYEAWKRAGSEVIAEADCGTGPGSCGGADLAVIGRAVAERRQCVACHTLDGQPHIGPTWSRLFGSTRELTDGRRVVADEAYLTRSMMEPNIDVVAGYRDLMPSYQGVLQPAEAAAIVELIRSLRDGQPPSGVVLPKLEIEAVLDGGTSP